MSNLWDRKIKIIFTKESSQIVIEKGKDNNYLYFTVETNNDTTESSNIANITCYNLSKEYLSVITENCEVEILAGYGSNLNTIYKGIVEKIQGIRQVPDIVHKITCSTYNDEYKRTKIDLKIPKNTKASAVIKTIVGHLEKIKIGKIELGEDIQYKDGKTIHNNLKTIFKTIAKDTKSIFYISNGLLYFQKANEYNRGSFTVPDNFVREATQNEDGYTIISNFSSEIVEGMKFKGDFKDEITGLSIKGEFPVVKIRHKLSFKDDFLTEFEVINEVIKKENEKSIEIVVGGGSKAQTSKKKGKGKSKRYIPIGNNENYTIY